jgi:3'(2'), 5'-bisphosphate nucleotidase
VFVNLQSAIDNLQSSIHNLKFIGGSLPYKTELDTALTIVRQAALLARRIQAEMISPALSKSDRSPVTVADFAVQALVARRLMEAFPADPLMAEEDSSALRDTLLLPQVTAFVSGLLPEATPASVCAWIDRGGAFPVGAGLNPQRMDVPTTNSSAPTILTRYWMLDPIDGTKGFLRGGQYAVALTLMVDGLPQVGVLGCPELGVDGDGICTDAKSCVSTGVLAYAVRGQGAWAVPLEPGDGTGDLYPVRLRVSSRSDPAQARLLRSFEAGHTNVGQIEQFAAVLGVQADPLLMDSQAKYAVLAGGHGDLILRLLSAEQPNYHEKAWDQAAGTLVVEEAGGRATDLDGRPFDFTAGRELVRNRGVVVSNGALHAAALRALKEIGA